jgi:hypothetical protein
MTLFCDKRDFLSSQIMPLALQKFLIVNSCPRVKKIIAPSGAVENAR